MMVNLHGTAGAPLLNIIQKNELTNVLIIVTRYFGGTLLGTGGLVKAYSTSALEVLKNTQIVEKEKGYLALIEIKYADLEKFKYYCKKEKINIQNIKYSENIEVEIEISKKTEEKILTTCDTLKINLTKIDIIEQKYIVKS